MSEVVETQTTLRDQLEAAFDNESPQETVNVEQQTTDRPRDEAGRFTPQTDEKPQAENKSEVPQVRQRPTSWKKDYEEHWGKLDPTLQDYIHQRESDYAKGVSMYKQNYEQAAPIYEAMQPFMPVLQQHNMQPAQWIQGLGNAHMTLVNGSPEQKLQMFAQLANDYGVPLQALTGQQYDPQFSMLAQELGQMKNQWQQFQMQREQMEDAQIKNEIETFSTDKQYFEDVRMTMAQLLESNVAKNLPDAYDKAIRLHDDIWQKQQESAKQVGLAKAAENQRATVAKAKATAVSPRSISPTATMGSGNGKKSLRDILTEQVEGQIGGRV